MRAAASVSPAFSAWRCITTSQASSGRRQPWAEAVSAASAATAGRHRGAGLAIALPARRTHQPRQRIGHGLQPGDIRRAAIGRRGQGLLGVGQQWALRQRHGTGQVVGVGLFGRRGIGPQRLETGAGPGLQGRELGRAAQQLGPGHQVHPPGARQLTPCPAELGLGNPGVAG